MAIHLHRIQTNQTNKHAYHEEHVEDGAAHDGAEADGGLLEGADQGGE
jgi:hypothetical protein